MSLDTVGQASYALVTSYRKDGRAVPTPVWVVRDGDTLALWTVTDSGKVKRIRREGRVRLAACDARGGLRGEWLEGRARLRDDAGTERVRALLRHKYGVMGRVTLFFSRLRRGRDGTIGIRVSLT